MLNLTLSFSNLFNILFGIFLGFFLMVIVSCSVIKRKVAKKNKNEKIREISTRTYYDFYLKNDKMKDKMISALIYQTKEISKINYPDKNHPLFELSFNEIVDGINLIQQKLKKIVVHPLFKDFKNIHITTLLNIEENIAKPAFKIYNKKTIKMLNLSYKVFKSIINIFNPLFYIKKILNIFLVKKGKKDISIIILDLVGNTIYGIYNNEKNLQK